MKMEDYLIKNTTKEQRENLVKEALAISVSGVIPPSEEATKLVKQYIDGEKELIEVQKEIINLYKN